MQNKGFEKIFIKKEKQNKTENEKVATQKIGKIGKKSCKYCPEFSLF